MVASRQRGHRLARVGTLALPTPGLALVQAPASAAVGAVQDLSGCADNTLPRNDDRSTGVVSLPFGLNFYGQGYTQAYVNNNGNITFDMPLSTYTPFGIVGTFTPIIAP